MTKDYIFLISGLSGVGKSSFIEACSKVVPGVVELSTVDLVKSVATCVGWDGIKTEESREFLYNLKVVLENSPWGDLPNLDVVEMVKELPHCINFINVRETRNAEKLIEMFREELPDHKVVSIYVTCDWEPACCKRLGGTVQGSLFPTDYSVFNRKDYTEKEYKENVVMPFLTNFGLV